MNKTVFHAVIAACSLLLLSMCTYAQNVGIGTAVPNTGLDVVRDLALREAAAVTINAMNQINSGTASHLRVTNTGTINQILGGQDGKVLYLINNSGGAIVLANNAAATANKIFTGTGANYSLPNQATAHLIYNPTLGTPPGAWQLAGTSPSAGSSNAWLLLGNAGTNPAVNFIGTTDAQSLRFRVNNQFSGLIEHAANDGNTAFGYNAMSNLSTSGAMRNVAVGDGVLGALNPINPWEGDDNTGIGYRALYSNTTGSYNTATGSQALVSNTTGFSNTATGVNALYSNTTGFGNTATGVNALVSNSTGFSNTATGARALYSNTTGFSNTATGRRALYNTDGWQNTAVGDSAGYTNIAGTNNTYLGYRADAAAGNFTNSTAIGANAQAGASNAMVLGSINGVNGATANTNVGIGTTIPNTALDIARDLALREAAAVTITANQINSGTASHLRVTNTGTINEILNPQNGKVLYLINNSGGAIVLANNAAATANKIFTGTGANYSLPNQATAHLIYNPTPAPGGWRLAGVSPGTAAAASAGWLLTGNAGTNPAVNFIGTTDAQSLRFRVNNQFSGLIEHAANDGNTAFGYNAMSILSTSGAVGNVAVGDGVLGALNPINSWEGDDNTGIGYRALYSNTTGSYNTATGARALRDNTTGFSNTATGSSALISNTNGYLNTATGRNALLSNTTGFSNTATGARALLSNITGFSNLATGFQALYSNTTGWQNTAVGDSAGYTNIAGTGNTYLGYRADAAAGNFTNSTAIGANAQAGASNAMVLGSINGVNGATANTNVGIGTTIPNTALDIARDLALREAAAVTITANQINSGSSSHLRVTTPGTINEILNPQNGKVLYLINNSGGAITLANNAVATANKLFTGSGADYTLPAGATAHLIYNPTPAPGAWRLTGVSPGAAAASAGGGWLLTGNAGTNPAVNFIGTTDAQSLRFKVNNQFSGLIEAVPTGGNTAFGYNAMDNLIASGATRNVAVGDGVLTALIDGDGNTGIGYRALISNTTGSYNTATGAWALLSNTTGVGNVATGIEALYFNTTGWYNTATGYQALDYNTTGWYNTATGYQALYSNTTGFSNTATGADALNNNTTGWQNTATGAGALGNNTTGWNNTAIGFQALYYNGNGSFNTALGDNAGFTNTVGTGNTYLGSSADANAGSYSNSIAIGAGATVTSSNRIRMGNTAITNADIQVAWTVTSDKNEKSEIKYDVPGLKFITQLRPVTYYYNSHLQAHGKEKSIRYTGLLAQDVDSVLRQLGIVSSIVSKPASDGSGSWGIRYAEIVMPLIKGMQEQQAQIEALQKENAELKKDNAELKKDNAELRELTTKLDARLKSLEDRTGIKAEK